MLDAIDVRILSLLQRNARIANAEVARDLEMAPSAVLERIRKLESRGYITSYETRLAPKLVGLGLTAFIFVKSDETSGWEATSDALASISEVQEVHNIAGEDCFLVKVRLRDTDHLASVLRDKLRVIPHIRSTRTTIVLETVKETSQLKLDVETQEVAT
ncbi:MAG: Lrp/AsnC family transcriptional regulator [Pirellula sp.]|jgi:Lrp/AsnC family leucine-responsive transcriptional regulator|nr:Lrp/AsnC family transcriptional regulator [Pirellula sp.]